MMRKQRGVRTSYRVAMMAGAMLAPLRPVGADRAGEPDPHLRQAEITLAPQDRGRRVMTVRLRPAQNARHDTIVFECVYRQALPVPDDPDGDRRIHEPVNFRYRHRNVELVNDLDWYGSFRVPVDHALLRKAYGSRAFDPDHPVIIHRVIVRAVSDGQTVWTHTFAVPGRHNRIVRPDAEAPAPPSALHVR